MKKRHFFIVVLLIAIVAVLLLRQHFAGKVSSGETLMVQQVKVQQSNSISSLAPAVVPEAISSKVDLQKLDEERQRLVEQGAGKR